MVDNYQLKGLTIFRAYNRKPDSLFNYICIITFELQIQQFYEYFFGVQATTRVLKPRFDSSAPGALVLSSPPALVMVSYCLVDSIELLSPSPLVFVEFCIFIS